MTNILSKIFSSGAKDLTVGIGNVVDKFITTDTEKLKAKNELAELVLSKLNEITAIQGEVLKTELQGNWLQRSWRPILMLVFAALLVMKWMGITQSVDIQVELQLMEIIKLGLGGYIIGRSAEKITKELTTNVDLAFLKKKDRKDQL